MDETYREKTRETALLYGENCMILTSAVFDRSTGVTDRRTDRQTDRQTETDGIAIAYSWARTRGVQRVQRTDTRQKTDTTYQQPTSQPK